MDPSLDESLTPILSPAERQELAHLNYHHDRLDRLHDRGLLGSEAHAAAIADAEERRQAILRNGRVEAALQQARRRQSRDPKEALAWARRACALDPQRIDAQHLVVELERAVALAERLRPQPVIPPSPGVVFLDASDIVEVPAKPQPKPAPVPSVSWKSIAAEFLEDHWQKLILCLAVMLIVVSSTVGAHQLLGERLLWSRAGQCVLAAVYTAVFAAFGYGLVRWGAERAGRIMLLTTLCVVPVNFSLAGELRLIVLPSTWHLIILLGVMAVMFIQVWVVSSTLGLRGGGLFPLAYFVLAAFDATAARGVPFDWGFTALVASAWVFVLSVSRLNAQLATGEATEERREFAYFALGLLAYAFLFFAYRSGIFVLRLVPRMPTLMSVPMILAAIATAHTAHVLPRLEKDPRRVSLVHVASYVLAALAFALALMHPPVRTALIRGNTLTTAVLGLGLFAASLATYRRPPYLYAAFGALWLAYFGVHDVVRDLLDSYLEPWRNALGYHGRLPFPFAARNAIVFNLALVGLSLVFRRRWFDARLAAHCHYIGLPLSIGACVLSSLEPKAALLCLPVYTVLYAAAAWLFAQPLLVYLACGATAGTALALGRLDPSLTPQARALGASVLGLVFWAVAVGLSRRKAAISYRPPSLHAALAMCAIALVRAVATLAVIAPASVVTFFVVALVGLLVSGDLRHRALAYATLASTSVGVLVLAAYIERVSLGDLVASHRALAAAAGFVLLMVPAAEGLRRRETLWGLAALYAPPPPPPYQGGEQILAPPLDKGGSGGVRSSLSQLYASALADFAPVAALILSLWSLVPLHNDRPLVLTLALAGATLLGATRFHRYPGLVYLGLSHAVLAALGACDLLQSWANLGLGLGWLALTLGALALSFWTAGLLSLRAGDDGFYARPCFHTILLLVPLDLALAIAARVWSPAAFPVSLTALLLGMLALVLLTTIWRWGELTYGAIVMLTAAVYVTLFSLGEPRPDTAYVLGLTAALEGLVLWTIGAVCLAHAESWRDFYALPLFVSTLVLGMAAVVPGYAHPPTMALVGLIALLAIKSFPNEAWLYPALGAFATSVYFAWVAPLPEELGMACALGGAYALWAAGVLVQVTEPALCRGLRLKELAYEEPLFQGTVVAAAVAVFLRWDLLLRLGGPVTAHLWLPVGLAILSLLMLRAYPHPLCVHLSVGLWTLSLALRLQPELSAQALWLPIGMALALAWDGLGRGLGRAQEPLCRRLGVGPGDYASILRDWALAIFGASALVTATVVVSSVVLDADLLPIDPRIAWPAVLVALVLGGLASDVLASDGRRGGLRLGLLVVPALVAWWLGVPTSPLMRARHLEATQFLPLATIVVALGTVLAGLPFGRSHGPRLAVYQQHGWHVAAVLAVVALGLGHGLIGPATVVTLLGATAVAAIVAVSRQRIESGYAAALAWVGTLVYAMLWVVGWPERWAEPSVFARPAAYAALGAVAAAFSLLGAAPWCGPARSPTFGRRLALALEHVAALAATAGVALVGAAFVAGGRPQGIAGLTIALLCGLAVFAALLARRWRVEWPVYAAQALIVAAYFDYRYAFPLSAATDALVLVLFGYVDFAVAETLRRLRLDLYARPTLVFSLALPILPLVLSLGDGMLDDVTWFTVFSTAAFYTAAGYRLERKSLGYAAAVLYNAFLWIAWARVGWKLEDHPQFFLIPVGLSTILFAEANRRALGRPYVNALRSAGLVIIYLSLAVPIWQQQSFGAWLTLLAFSLAGIVVGIGLRVQSFLWLGLGCFCLDVLYQLGRVGMENVLARMGIMLGLGILMVLFVAFSEKKRIVLTMREYYAQVRQWE